MGTMNRTSAGGALGAGLAAGVMTACGGIAIIDFDGGTGQGGAPSSSVVGGIGGTSNASTVASTSASDTSTTGAGGGPIRCQGWKDSVCGTSAHCQPDGDSCDGSGKCVLIPQTCSGDCPGICACDGKKYCNACTASAQGVAAVPGLICDPAPTESYHAVYWAGGMDHVLVGKKDTVAGSCVWVHLNYPRKTEDFEIDAPKGWSVFSVDLSNNADDCDDLSKQLVGQVANTTDAEGAVKWVIPAGKSIPCNLSIAVKAGFLNPPPGLKNDHELKTDDLTIKNGCS